MNNRIELAALLVVLSFSFALAYAGLFESAGFALPTYDNSMLHSGRVRFITDTGHWSDNELVFGGKTISYHVPAYASLVASLSFLTGLNWLWAIRLFALLQSLLLPLGAYLLARKLADNGFAGVAAAFFVLISENVMTWGTRTSAISLGVVLVLFALYFVLCRMTLPAVLCVVVLAFTHQPSLLVVCLTLALFTVFEFLGGWWSERKGFWKHVDLAAFFSGLAGFLAYMAWHLKVTGLSCLDFKCLPQLSAHEYGASVDLLAYFLKPQAWFALPGLAWFYFMQKDVRAKMLVAAWFIACLLLVKNDVFGLAVFTERFVAFFDLAAAVLSGVFVGGLFKMLEDALK